MRYSLKSMMKKAIFHFIFLITLLLMGCQSKKRDSKESVAFLNLKEGRNMYHIRGCVACHGIKGDGKGDRSSRLNPSPRDFRDTNAYRQGYEIKEIAQTLKTGVDGTPAMPQYPYLSEEERINIAKYVYFLQTNKSTNLIRSQINIIQ